MNSEAPLIEQGVSPFIDGKLLDSASDAVIHVVNPSNGKRCVTLPAGSGADVESAVTASMRAFEDGRWSDASPSFRKDVLHRLADLIATESYTLDMLDAGEMGKPISLTFGNAAAAATLMRFHAEAVDKLTGDVYTSDRTNFVAQRRVPRGVVAAITPWNFPTYVTVVKLAPALAAGNCVVVKPSELASRSAIRIAHLAMQAGLPPGVLNVVPGLGETVGRSLGLHRDVHMVTFTGSTKVGKLMLHYAAESNMKVVMAECGGKSPQIVFADGVDLDAAAETIARSLLTNQGQICSVGSRLLVQRSIESVMVEKIVARFKGIIMGDALNPGTTFGPLVSEKQRARVMSYVESAAEGGAQLITGGRRSLPETGGFFFEPTLFRNVSPNARIAQEEIFGPVLSVIAFDDEAEAISIANETIYGLAAYVWTASLSTGMRMAKALRSSVRISSAAPVGEGAGHGSSFEPSGESGIGTEGGIAGMESYLRRQRIWFNHS